MKLSHPKLPPTLAALGVIAPGLLPPIAAQAQNAGDKYIPPIVATQLAAYLSEQPLTPRESEILKHVSTGNSNRDIGKLLFISEQTVKAHLRHIMDKLGASDRAHCVAIAARRGYLEL